MINFRPFLCFALSFAAGIALAYFLGSAAYWFAFGWLAFAASAAVIGIIRHRAVFGILLFTAFSCALFSLGAFSFSMRVGKFESYAQLQGEYTVTGTVEQVNAANGGWELIVGSLSFTASDGSPEENGACMSVLAYGTHAFSEGDLIRFTAEVESSDVVQYGRVNASAISENTRYRAFVRSDEIEVLGTSFRLFGAVRERLRTVLFEHMGVTAAPVGYAALTGDSGFVEDGLLQDFRYGGVAHVFAVSGLHIGIVYAALSALLRKVRLHRYARIPVVAAVLFFYVGVCRFSASAVRALIMCLVLMVMDTLGVQYDRLTSVSIAALIILLLDPVDLFSVGFQLSVAAAAGIIVLSRNLGSLLERVPFFSRKVSDALAVSLSAQAATFPVMLDSFGYVSGVGIFLNILFIPLFSAVYVVLFFTAMAACVLPFAGGVLLYLPDFLLRAVVTPISVLEFDVLLICGFSFGGCMALWFAALAIASDKINVRPILRAVGVCVLSALFAVCMVVRNVTPGTHMTLHAYYGMNVALLYGNDQVCVIVDGGADETYLSRLFMQEGIDRVDVAIVLADAKTVNTTVPSLLRCVEVSFVYAPSGSGLVGAFTRTEVLEQSGFFSLGSGTACFVDDAALYLEVNNTSVLLCMEEPQAQVPHCDLLITAQESDALNAACLPSQEICFEKSEQKISIYRLGELQIVWKDDIIGISG